MRESHSPLRDGIRPLVFPRSVAVIGASPRRADSVASVVASGIPAWGIHPSRREVLGLPCVPSVRELEAVPETGFLLVGHERVEEAFAEAAEAGIRAFVLPGLGNESGAAGRAVAERIARRAGELGIAVLGPNCMGVAAPGEGALWIGTVPETVAPGHVSVVSQSGSIAEALLALGGRVGFRCIVSSGAEAVRDAADILAFLAADEETRAVGLFLETVRRPAALARALKACAEAGKPVAGLKVGRSEAARRTTVAHTGAIAGSAAAFSALLRRYGAIEVDDFPDLVETLEVLGRRRRPRGLRIGAVSESGGEAALLADHAAAAGMPFEPLPDGLADRLQAEFPNYTAPGNPLDAWAVDEVERVYPRSLELMARTGAYDVLVAQVDLSQFRGAPEKQWCSAIVRALAEVTDRTEIFPAVTTVHTADPWPDVAADAHAADVALLRGPGAAVRALAAVARWRPRVPPPEPARDPVELGDLLAGHGPRPELESSAILERYGVPFAPRERAASPEEVGGAAERLGFPIVVKRDGPAHKSRDGGVILGLGSREAVVAAAEHLGGPVIVATQVPAGIEAMCGLRRDPDYGPVVVGAAGGTAAEEADDAVAALAPLGLDAALEAVAEVRALAPITQPARRVLAETLVALGRLACDHPEVVAVDVNPLIVAGDTVVAVDALVDVERGD